MPIFQTDNYNLRQNQRKKTLLKNTNPHWIKFRMQKHTNK